MTFGEWKVTKSNFFKLWKLKNLYFFFSHQNLYHYTYVKPPWVTIYFWLYSGMRNVSYWDHFINFRDEWTLYLLGDPRQPLKSLSFVNFGCCGKSFDLPRDFFLFQNSLNKLDQLNSLIWYWVLQQIECWD